MKINEFTNEAEGTPEGLPHLTDELIKHIVQQVGTEGARAICRSLTWGDGAAKELLQLIVKDLKNNIGMAESVKQRLDPKCWKGKHKEGTKIKGGVRVNNCVPNESVEVDEEWSKKYKDSINCSNPKGFSQKAHCASKQKNEELSLDEQFDIIEEMVNWLAESKAVDAEVIWEDIESIDDYELCALSEDWQKANRKDKTAGMSRKAVKAYRRENPGSKLQTAVTTKPSKLKPGSKAAKRRKSFCARMKGNKGPMKKPNGKPTNKALALRRWNC